jgi:hypothetical protein
MDVILLRGGNLEKRKEYAEGEVVTCPKCGSDILNIEAIEPYEGECLNCGCHFTIRQVAIWQE